LGAHRRAGDEEQGDAASDPVHVRVSQSTDRSLLYMIISPARRAKCD
jgi:hypothetical protein